MSSEKLQEPQEGGSETAVTENKLSAQSVRASEAVAPPAAVEIKDGETGEVGDHGEKKSDSGSGHAGDSRKSTGRDSGDLPKTDSKNIEEEKKKDASKHSRRKSMFDEIKKGSFDKEHDGELKETLATFFSNAPKEAADNSQALKPLRRPKLIYENSFRLEATRPFSPSRVQSMMEDLLEEMLIDFKYNSKNCAPKATEVAEKIRRNVLAYRYDRYKICTLVTISPLNRQGFHNGFRCLWDPNRDSYAVATLRNPSIFAIAVVYAIYFE